MKAKMDRAHDSSRSKFRAPAIRVSAISAQAGDSMSELFPPPGLPAETVIDVWQIDLDEALDAGVKLDAILSPEERARAVRLIYPRGADRYRKGRAMLRMGLGWYLGKHPGKIELVTGWRGKPELAEASALHFNVTHCHEFALIAFTTAGELGVDVEAIDRTVEAQDIANENFTQNEAALIAAAGTPEEQAKVFLSFWTRKEAVLKATGGGLLHGLHTVDVSDEPPGVVELGGEADAGGGSRWLVRDIEGIEGFASAIAAPVGDWVVRQWPIRCGEAIQRLGAKFPGLW